MRGIYDRMTTGVDAVFLGKERKFNRRFLQICYHCLFEPVACTPAAGCARTDQQEPTGRWATHQR